MAKNTIAQFHQNLWLKLALKIPLNKKLSIETEFLHRTQSGLKNKNPLSNNLLYAVRPWIQYQQSKNIIFSVSPFAYFRNYGILLSDIDAIKNYVPEYRFAIATEVQNELLLHCYLNLKSGIEYRHFENMTPEIIRFRNKFGIKYDFNKKWNINLYDEIFLNFKGVDKSHFYDHNRIGIAAT